MKLRIKFRKFGAVRFIGHLDVMRFFQKAIRRAGIDVRYTEGFSPHQVMTFAAPLGVGLESNGEYMDIEVLSMESTAQVKEALNHASVPGIEVIDVKILPDQAGNAMASVYSAEYTVRFRQGRKPAVDFAQAVGEFLAREEILISKVTKKCTREVNLKPGIHLLDWNSQEEIFHMILDASSAGNIKPIQVIEAMIEPYGERLAENALQITREEVYTNIGTEERPVAVPLGEIGTDE